MRNFFFLPAPKSRTEVVNILLRARCVVWGKKFPYCLGARIINAESVVFEKLLYFCENEGEKYFQALCVV